MSEKAAIISKSSRFYTIKTLDASHACSCEKSTGCAGAISNKSRTFKVYNDFNANEGQIIEYEITFFSYLNAILWVFLLPIITIITGIILVQNTDIQTIVSYPLNAVLGTVLGFVFYLMLILIRKRVAGLNAVRIYVYKITKLHCENQLKQH